MTEHEHPCSKRIVIGWRAHPCPRKGKMQRDGKWYCWQHDPERIKQQGAKHQVEWDAERKRRRAKARLSDAGPEYHEAVGELLADLKGSIYRTPWLVQHRDRLADIYKRAEGEPEEGGKK